LSLLTGTTSPPCRRRPRRARGRRGLLVLRRRAARGVPPALDVVVAAGEVPPHGCNGRGEQSRESGSGARGPPPRWRTTGGLDGRRASGTGAPLRRPTSHAPTTGRGGGGAVRSCARSPGPWTGTRPPPPPRAPVGTASGRGGRGTSRTGPSSPTPASTTPPMLWGAPPPPHPPTYATISRNNGGAIS